MLRKVVDLERDKLREMPDIGHDLPIFARGRLTLEPGEPDYFGVPAKVTTLHFSPYVGCYEFTEIDLPLGGYAADTNFDIFYKNHILYSEAWATATIRNVAIARVQGYLSHATDDQKRFVGTIRTTDAIGNTADSVTQRFVSNYYNRIPKWMYAEENTSHTYNGAARLWNNSVVNNSMGLLVCQPNGISIQANLSANLIAIDNAANYARIALYMDGVAVTLPSLIALTRNGFESTTSKNNAIYVPTGYHYFECYEVGNDNASTFDDLSMSLFPEV